MKKRFLATLLCLIMIVCMLPTAALAAGERYYMFVTYGYPITESGLNADREEVNNPGWTLVSESKTLTLPNTITLLGIIDLLGDNSGNYISSEITVVNQGEIAGGTFNGPVTNYGAITGGTFNGPVTNYGTITGGTFTGSVTNSNGSITGGYFYNRPTNQGQTSSFGGSAKVVKDLSIENRGGTATIGINGNDEASNYLLNNKKGFVGTAYSVGNINSSLVGLYLVKDGDATPLPPYSIDTTTFRPILGGVSYDFTMPEANAKVLAIFYVPVTDISGVPATVVKNTDLTLSASVAPMNATYYHIVWSVKNANGTGASVTESGGAYTFRATAAGTATVTATIANGKTKDTAYTEDFDIVVTDAATYSVTVTGGTGGGEYAAGETVTITADAPAANKRFKEWTGVSGLTFTEGSATTATAKFTMPAAAVAVTATYETDVPAVAYTLYYSSTDSKLHIDGLTGAEYTGNSGNWSGSGTTLTLNNFHFTTSAATALVLPDQMTLVLNGTSTVTSTYKGNSPSYGIYSNGARSPLMVSGTGSLTATGGESWQSLSYGLRVNSNGLTLTGGCTLNGISGAAMGASVGIHANTITVTDSTLSGRGAWGGTSYGVNAAYGLATVNGNGVLTGTGGDVRASNESSYGVYLYGGVTISGNGTLTGVGGSAPSGVSCGVYNRTGSIDVAGGTFIATGGEARDASYGVQADNSVCIAVSSGAFTATGGESTGSSYGVSVKNGAITASGGQFTAKTTSTVGTHQALSTALTLQNGMIAQGSASSSGADPVTYTPASNSYYQWVQAAMPPTYTVTLGLTLDGAAYTGQTVAIQDGTGTSYPLTEGANGAYTNAAVPNGSYTIYKGGVSTGQTVTVSNASSSAALEFFTVSFGANGGTPAPAAQVVLKNGYAAAPAAMTKGTDIFGGWYSDAALSSAWTFGASPVTGATTLYAKWTSAQDFRPVTEISDVLGRVAKDVDVTLTGTVGPANATNKTIVWGVSDAGTTGASIAESGGVYTLRATATGTLTVTATIANGLASGPYTQDFDIVVVDSPAYTMDFTLTNATWGNLSGVDLTTTDAQGTGWSWASQSKTLTLNSLRFTTVADTAIRLPRGTTLVLNGTSAATSTYSGGGEDTCGIECGGLTISGGGTLNATGGVSPRKCSRGALIYNSLTVNSGTLNLMGGGGSRSYGAEIGDSITMNSGTLNATAGTSGSGEDSSGLTTHGDIIMNAGVINAVGNTYSSNAYGIHIRDFGSTSSDITIFGGTLNAKGGSGALSKAPITIANVIARASRDMSGSAPEIYDSAKNREYKWFSAAPTTPLTGLTLSMNAPAVGTEITATVAPAGATASYQWYMNTTAATTGGTAKGGATNASYTPASADEGKYLYCIATGTGSYSGTASAVAATAVTRAASPEPIRYQITQGQNGQWTKGGSTGLRFTASGEHSKFSGIRVDGSAIASDKYTTASGSTVVTLKASYLETLDAGEHRLRVNFTDGYAATRFTVKAAANSNIPATGDASAPMLWLGIMLLSSAGSAACLAVKRRRKY